jgi:hypothetical protein
LLFVVEKLVTFDCPWTARIAVACTACFGLPCVWSVAVDGAGYSKSEDANFFSERFKKHLLFTCSLQFPKPIRQGCDFPFSATKLSLMTDDFGPMCIFP